MKRAVVTVMVVLLACALPAWAAKAKADKGKAKADGGSVGAQFTGTASAKPADAAAGVAGILTCVTFGQETKYNLLTGDPALVDQIKGFAEKGTTITVTGTKNADGTGIEVASVQEGQPPAKGGKAGGKKGKK